MFNKGGSMTTQLTYESYHQHIPIELRHLPIFGVALGKRPTLPWNNRDNLFTFNEAMAKLTDQNWVAERRKYIVFKAKRPRPDLADAPARLMVVLTDTPYWVQDYDYRKLRDDDGNFIKKGNQILKRNEFDPDQLEVLEIEKKHNWGYQSSSGEGYHIWVKQRDDQSLCKIQDNHLNTIADCNGIEGKYLSPYELKHDVIYIPENINPINDAKKISYANEITQKYCNYVTDYRNSKLTKPTTSDKVKTVATKTEDPTGLALQTPRPIKKHKDTERFIAQCRWMVRNKKSFLPNRAEFSGFIIRCKSMGIPDDTIVAICKTQPNFNPDTDLADIANVAPSEDIDTQVKVAFSQLKKFGFDTKADLFEYGYPPAPAPKPEVIAKSIREEEDDYDPPPIDKDVASKPLPQLTGPGDFITFASPAGHGKSTQAWHWMRELSDLGYYNIHISGDQSESQAKAKMRRVGCEIEKTAIINLRGHRIVNLKDLMSAIDAFITNPEAKPGDEDEKYPVGIITLDPAPKIIRSLWATTNGCADPDNQTFIPEQDAHAHKAIDNIVLRLAKEYRCCVILIAHPARNSAGRDRYPGCEAWMGDAGITYRLYSLNRITAKTIPDAILDVFRGIPSKERSNYRVLSSMGKSRYYDGEGQVPDFLTHIPTKGPDTGRLVTEVISNEIDLDKDEKSTKSFPDKDEYLQKLKDHLLKNPGEWVSLAIANREIGHRAINKHYVYGILWDSGHFWGASTDKHQIKNKLYWSRTKGGMSVMHTDSD